MCGLYTRGKDNMINWLKKTFSNEKLHWTTIVSEKFLLAIIGALTMMAAIFEVYHMMVAMKNLNILF